VLCLSLVSLSLLLFLWFLICRLNQVCSEVHSLTSYGFYSAKWQRTAQSKRYTRLGASLLENRNKCHASLQIRQGQRPQKRLCQLTLVLLCSCFCISWPLKMGPTRCPEMSVQNYHSMLHYIPEECRFHMTMWWSIPLFGSAWSGWKQSCLMQSSSVLHTWSEDDLTYLSNKLKKKKTWSCLWVNMVTMGMVYIQHISSYILRMSFSMFFVTPR
jgi:hypothetical protein